MASSLADVFAVINRLQQAGVVDAYAVGGATAVLFYAEPARTYDVDVFVIVRGMDGHDLAPLAGIDEWAGAQGYQSASEHILIEGVPVQFLPTYTSLVDEAVRGARVLPYGEVPVRVVGPEHLVALAIQAGGAKRRERACQALKLDSQPSALDACMIYIYQGAAAREGFDWDAANVAHISRHGVLPADAEQALTNDPITIGYNAAGGGEKRWVRGPRVFAFGREREDVTQTASTFRPIAAASLFCRESVLMNSLAASTFAAAQCRMSSDRQPMVPVYCPANVTASAMISSQ